MTTRAPSGSPVGARNVYPISLCMIVRNEERFLAGCLESVRDVVDEICIADTGSTDATVAIAESFGARLTHIAWRDDFAWARNAALAMATGAWIFVLDADEVLAPESRAALHALRTRKPDVRGLWIQCRNLSDPVRGTVASTNAIMRIFPNDPAIRYRGSLHEFVTRDGEERALPGDKTPIEIVHYGYTPGLIAERDKAKRNLALSRSAFEDDPDNPTHVYNYAMSALLAGERETALAQLERVVEITLTTPRGFRPQALIALAGMYVEAGRGGDALRVADACIAAVASLPDGYFARGRALTVLGRYHDARDAFGQAITASQNPSFEHFVVEDEIGVWKAHNEIGGTLVLEKRFPEALAWLDLALAARPAEPVLILNRARCLEAMNDLAGALAGFRAAFDGFHDESAAIEYVNFVFRHGGPDVCLTAVESALPFVSESYQRAFLTSAAAAMLRAGRREEASKLVLRVTSVGDDPVLGRAVILSLANHYGTPELNGLLGPADAR